MAKECTGKKGGLKILSTPGGTGGRRPGIAKPAPKGRWEIHRTKGQRVSSATGIKEARVRTEEDGYRSIP